MRSYIKRMRYLSGNGIQFSYISQIASRKYHHNLPILDFYKKTTGDLSIIIKLCLHSSNLYSYYQYPNNKVRFLSRQYKYKNITHTT